MFEQWVNRITEMLDPAASSTANRPEIERVSATLLVEIARADHDIDISERQSILSALSSEFYAAIRGA